MVGVRGVVTAKVSLQLVHVHQFAHGAVDAIQEVLVRNPFISCDLHFPKSPFDETDVHRPILHGLRRKDGLGGPHLLVNVEPVQPVHHVPKLFQRVKPRAFEVDGLLYFFCAQNFRLGHTDFLHLERKLPVSFFFCRWRYGKGRRFLSLLFALAILVVGQGLLLLIHDPLHLLPQLYRCIRHVHCVRRKSYPEEAHP